MPLQRRQFLLGLGASSVGLGLGISQIVAKTTTATEPTLLAQNTPSLPPRSDLRCVVISDINSSYGSTDYEPEVDRAVALIQRWKPDIVLCAGDMVAGQSPALSRSQMQAMWQAFDQRVAAPLRKAKIPYAFTLGNHDASGALGTGGRFLYGTEREVAASFWREPRHDLQLKFVDRSGFPFYYTFEHKGVFFLVWDASTATVPAAQVAWAERSLASPQAQAAKMRIMIGHIPFYPVAIGRDDPGEFLDNANNIHQRLERLNVHTYISGHDHAYYPGRIGKIQMLQAGLLGTGIRPLLVGNRRPQKALTVLDINLQKQETTYTTFDPTTMKLIDAQQLPRLIPGPVGNVLRRDVALSELTPAERQMRYTPSR